MSKIFKPRRIKYSTATGTKGAGIVPASGEMIVVSPTAGHGKGAGKIVIGDGSTTVQAYATNGKALVDDMKFSGSETLSSVGSDSSTTVATALSNVASGKTLSSLFGSLKQAVSLLNTSVTSLNDEKSDIKTRLTKAETRYAQLNYFWYTGALSIVVDDNIGLYGNKFYTLVDCYIHDDCFEDKNQVFTKIAELTIYAYKYEISTDDTNNIYEEFSYTPIINKLKSTITNINLSFLEVCNKYSTLTTYPTRFNTGIQAIVENLDLNNCNGGFGRIFIDNDKLNYGSWARKNNPIGMYCWNCRLAFSYS